MQDILKNLTEPQRQAVTHIEGPVLVLAGPGSGKTRVIVNRVAYMVRHCNIAPWNILAITFTNKAANEMKHRLEAMGINRGATVCTFHSLAVRLLREFSSLAELPPQFSIYDDSDQQAAVKEAMKQLEVDPKQYPPRSLLARISNCKNDLKMPDDVALTNDFDLRTKVFKRVYALYQEILQKNGAVDFDDLLVKLAFMLRDNPETLLTLNERYKYILVDEYQDTNSCQYQIARGLSLHHGNLFVSGDPDQSIYAWRGADIQNILAFEQDYPEATVIRLEENFRSAPEVLTLADEVISKNKKRKAKKLFTTNPSGPMPALYDYYNEYEEADGLADWIKQVVEEGKQYKDIAVFYRINSMSRVLEQSLRKAQIPYQIVRGVEFFKRKEIKDILSYLQLLVNPADQVALQRIINRPTRGIGNTSVDRLIQHSIEQGMDLWSVIQNVEQVETINAGAKAKVKRFADLIINLQKELETMNIEDIIRTTYKATGLEAQHETDEDENAIENVTELVNSATQFTSEAEDENYGLNDFLQQISLVGDADAYDEEAGVVSLMSLHAAKGLEFPAVRIVGIEENILPHSRCIDDPDGMEEERRLLFVGITRAEQMLTLSMAHNRTQNGMSNATIQSRFLRDLENIERSSSMSDETKNMWQQQVGYSKQSFGSRSTGKSAGSGGGWKKAAPAQSGYSRPAAKPEPTPSYADSDGITYEYEESYLREGQNVRHGSFGIGKIEKLIPGGSPKVVVNFQRVGRKTLVLEYAKLQAL